MANSLISMGIKAKASAALLATQPSGVKDRALLAIADALETATPVITDANALDLEAAKENGMSAAMQDRLKLNVSRIKDIADAVRQLVRLPDPVGQVLGGDNRPNGLSITKVSVPLGVVGLIYESRPNVTVDCAALCLKSGNACILRGGSEAIHSNKALIRVIRSAIERASIPADAVQLIEDTARETTRELMSLEGYVDVLIPRGGAGLIQTVVKNATVPVIETGAGICHLYVDSNAGLEMAAEILDNAKTSRPSVCNAVETLLVHESVAARFLPMAAARLERSKVELRACERALAILGSSAAPASDEDWDTEYDDYILSVKVVDSLEEAISFIGRHSTHHSETIVTDSYENARIFTQQVDSAAVYVNASTRFTDGGEFGLGAEIGISTQKLHVRGPMGLSALTSYKYIVRGDGQIR